MTSVEENLGERIDEPSVGQIATLFHDLCPSEGQGDVIENHPSVHESAADHDQFTTEARVLQHDLTILLVFHVPPVGLDQVHASAYVTLADDENAVLHHRHHEETERAAELQLIVKVLDLQDDEHAAGNEDEREQTVTEKVQSNVLDRVEERMMQRSWPRADCLQRPQIELHVETQVVLVTSIAEFLRGSELSLDHRRTSGARESLRPVSLMTQVDSKSFVGLRACARQIGNEKEEKK